MPLTDDEKLEILEKEHAKISRERDELTYRMELMEEQIHAIHKSRVGSHLDNQTTQK